MGVACFVAALTVWFAVVNTASIEISGWAVDEVPADWERWRAQWEFSHAGHFLLTLGGFLALLLATERASAADQRAPRRP